MIAAACIGVVLGVLGLQAPAVGSSAAVGADAPVDADAEARFKKALADLRARRFHVAATGFEALWREGRSTQVLTFAAQAREGAGHWLHALEHMRLLLAADPPLDERTRARTTTRMAAARRHTIPLVVRLRADDGAVGPARVTLRRVAPDELRPLLELAVEDGREIDVDPGVWSLTVQATGYQPRQRVFAVMPQRGVKKPEVVEFSLERVTVATVLAIGPDAAVDAGVQWTLTMEDEPGGLRTIGGAQAREKLSLAPGRWRARVEARGFVAQEFTWVAGEGDPPPVVLMAEEPPPAPAPVVRPMVRVRDPGLGLGLGLGLTGGVVFGVGVGMLIQHRDMYLRPARAPDNAAFVASLTGSAAASGMIGAGVGLAIAATTAAVPTRGGGISGIRDRGLWAELGVGGAVVLITSVWYSREWRRVQRDLYGQGEGGMSAFDVRSQQRETIAAGLLGGGAGLVIGAGAALVTRYVVRRSAARQRGVAIGGGPGLVGVGVRGRF